MILTEIQVIKKIQVFCALTVSPMKTYGKQIFKILCISWLCQTINIWCQLYQRFKLLISGL